MDQPLRVTHLSKSFGGGRGLISRLSHKAVRAPVRAVDDVSLEINRGEVFGVIGANGSGKSTLVRIVSTLLLPDAGDVAVFGLDAVHQPGRVRPYINRVSADPAFFKNMSTLENLLFFGRIYGMRRDQIEAEAPRILGRLGFEWAKAREPMSHLSRGQQQKVAIARSFLTSPVLMLLDEPTTGLDPRSKREVQGFIREVLAEHDATVLLTTHDMEEAELLCSRIAFLSRGAVVAEGTPSDLRRRVAGSRPLESITMDHVFMALTGQAIAEDEVREEATTNG
jgi:ABC-2 type transport system ATP-binding protein